MEEINLDFISEKSSEESEAEEEKKENNSADCSLSEDGKGEIPHRKSIKETNLAKLHANSHINAQSPDAIYVTEESCVSHDAETPIGD